MSIVIKHPRLPQLITITDFTIIKPCSENPTHIDFYYKAPKEDDRGEPDYTITFETQNSRNRWFNKLVRLIERINGTTTAKGDGEGTD